MSLGIDYGRGTTNIDHTTNIRYGVISQHSVLRAWADWSELDYGEPTCPKCCQIAQPFTEDPEKWAEDAKYEWYGGCADFVCESCELVFDAEDAYPMEANGAYYQDDDYAAATVLDNDIMICKSPFYTIAPFCSPCVPGAGNLDQAETMEIVDLPQENGRRWIVDGEVMHSEKDATERLFANGVMTYCFNHDWFDSGKAPYPVYSVKTGELVHADKS